MAHERMQEALRSSGSQVLRFLRPTMLSLNPRTTRSPLQHTHTHRDGEGAVRYLRSTQNDTRVEQHSRVVH